LALNLKKKLVKCHISSVALCGAENLTLQKVDQKCVEIFETWCWRRMVISWKACVKKKRSFTKNQEGYNKTKEG
jgi:hypothetical protein